MTVATDSPRCPWANAASLIDYHDREWGVPIHDDRAHFELICLEGAQAGLSWRSVLERRAHYRRCFFDFDPERVAAMGPAELAAIGKDPGVIRNRAKIDSVVTNARAFISLVEREGSFDDYVWSRVGGRPVVHEFSSMAEVPARTPMSDALAADLKRRGFRFFGPTIAYAYCQSAGLVLDHLLGCPRWTDLRS